MSQIFTIENDKVVITKLALSNLEGNIIHHGQLDLTGPVNVTGTLSVDTLKVKHLETELGIDTKFGDWAVNDEADLLDKGLSWTWGKGSVQLSYRSGNRLWSNSDIDIEPERTYKIDNTTVLSQTELGPQVTKSRLREVGILRDLRVAGNTALAEFAFFDPSLQRVGINTETPNGTFAIVDSNIEFVINATKDNALQLGTYTNNDFNIISDNTTRITVKNNGHIIIGNEHTNNAVVKIYGTLEVETIVADTRIDRFSPLEFKTSRDRGIYGLGLTWTGTGGMRQLIMQADPDRLWTSEDFDLASDRSYYIGGEPVLSAVGLGTTVTRSNLSKLGTLDSLSVDGEATFMSRINASRAVINARIIEFNDGEDFSITNSKITAANKLSFDVAGDETYYADANEIAIGNKQNNRRPIKMFGPVGIGINNPDPSVGLAVNGDISFANKKFTTGTAAPSVGAFNTGDICWNSNPLSSGYIGWVCLQPGEPGTWAPFGLIGQ